MGCDAEPDPTLRQLEPKRAPVEAVAKMLAFDAADLEAKVDPVALPGDLRTEMEAFTSVDACVKERSRIDPMLGDAIEAIGYDTFFADACRVIDAAKSGDIKRCDAIATSSLTAHCRATVAELRAKPNLCPWLQPTRAALGRDPACLAVASRAEALCRAEHDPIERAVCAGLLEPAGRGPPVCTKLFSHPQRERCLRAIARFRSALSPAEAPVDASAALAPSATLRVDRGESEGGVATIDVKHEVEAGTVLIEEHGGERFVLGTIADDAAFLASSPNTVAAFGVEIEVRHGRGGALEGHLRRLDLRLPGQAPLTLQSSATAGLKLAITQLAGERGGPIALTLDGPLRGPIIGLHLEVATFVRDMVTAADILAAGARHDDSPSIGAGP